MSQQQYASIRDSVNASSESTIQRVEVNQRALIDKILARYASAGAVYRELLQNSNDAEATHAEVYFTTSSESNNNNIVTQVVYRNNGLPFRPQDWSRLQKIAEGNPDVSKVGAFGVGAYTMFSICDEPLVVSGDQALAFCWKGDALWTRTGPAPVDKHNNSKDKPWTSFILPSRDPYPLPDLVEFGEFLCASLTFTKCLASVKVFVNNVERMMISKTLIQEPRPVSVPKSTASTFSWWGGGNNDAVVTSTTNGTFSLAQKDGMYESVYRINVKLDDATSSIVARYVSAIAKTRISADMARRMERVTKKQPPPTVNLQLFLNAQELDTDSSSRNGGNRKKNAAERITLSFLPRPGAGRIFIGFRTSQTTGLAAHVAAPFVPTVEREAMDLQDTTLKVFNLELLQLAGILMRLTLDHSFSLLDVEWQKNAQEREMLEQALLQVQQAEKKDKVAEQKDSDTNQDEGKEDENSKKKNGGMLGFARFMARGVTKQIVSVVKSVENILDDGSEFLNPPDPRPLCKEEKQAIMLMQSFCPQQSTPDRTVGMALADGFARCMPSVDPPVLTRSGVVRSNLAKLPNKGMEAFVKENVIRKIVYENAEEYHTVIAECQKLKFDELLAQVRLEVLEEEKVIRLIKWWTKYSKTESFVNINDGLRLKECIRFKLTHQKEECIVHFRDLLFYLEKESPLFSSSLPLPDTVLSRYLHDKIGHSTLTDSALRLWFSALPIDIWTDYISTQSCMTDAKPEQTSERIEVLKIMNQEYIRRYDTSRRTYGDICRLALENQRCIPFDTLEPVVYAAERPSELYLYSAELKAFDGVGSFHKVAASLQSVGVTEEFLLCLGVRKSVSIDFLFSHLDTLDWNSDPRPLVEYLRSATLTHDDLKNLSQTRYLPAAGDSTTFAPSELYLPNPDHRVFPFIKMLHWPSEEELSEKSESGIFLTKLGMKTHPPLSQILRFTSQEVNDESLRLKCLDFIAERLGPKGTYHDEYSKMTAKDKSSFRILPCVRSSPLTSEQNEKEMQSPVTCFSDKTCGVMGVAIIDPESLRDRANMYGSMFQCAAEPDTSQLINLLKHLVTLAKQKIASNNGDNVKEQLFSVVISSFEDIFKYLSHRSSDFGPSQLRLLHNESFIPCLSEGGIRWFSSTDVFFRRKDGSPDSVTEELFHVVPFSPFLAAAGVKEEASTYDLFQLLLKDPQKVLSTLGSEAKYRALLRRIAANPPFSRVTSEISNSPFLLAYSYKSATGEDTVDGGNAVAYILAPATDIYIVDNSFFARMFPVNRAPPESDLEDFYVLLGSKFISKSVQRRFEVVGKISDQTKLTKALLERILERSPLLISPSVTSRPLVSNAASLVSKKNLSVSGAPGLMAVYSLNGVVRRAKTTCFSKRTGLAKGVTTIYVVNGFDWFDVGYAIGDLILQRCQLEDAFFISSLLEAPLEQLKSRGFPVDRIIQPPPPPPLPVPMKPTETGKPPISAAAQSSNGVDSQATNVANIKKNEPKQEVIDEPNTTNSKPTIAAIPPSTGQNESAKDESNSSIDDYTTTPAQPQRDGFEQILRQMFPDADEDFLKAALGDQPSLDKVRSLAEQMSSGNYPRNDLAETETVATTASSIPEENEPPDVKKQRGGGIRRKLGRAFSGRRGNNGNTAAHIPSQGSESMSHGSNNSSNTIAGPATNHKHENSNPVSAASDAQSQHALENMLQSTVGRSTPVSKGGFESPDTVMTSIPEGLDRGSTCEVLSGQSLKPFDRYKCQNGIQLFSSRAHSTSEAFMSSNRDVIDKFSTVIEKLCGVYGLKLSSVAIFHDPSGGTIAFNRGGALHFNVRFFNALHYISGKSNSAECYSYWFVTIAHELAHHMVSAHNKEHGFYTESYSALYLPKLVKLLSANNYN